MDIKNSTLVKSFIISFLYVVLGTVAVLSGYPSSPLYGEWVSTALLLTLPVSVISFGIAFADATAFWSVLMVQLIVLLIFWRIVFKIMYKRKS